MFKRRFPFRRTRRAPFKRGFRPFAARVRPKYDRISLFNNLQGDFTNGTVNQAPGSGWSFGPCGPIVVTDCSQDANGCSPCVSPPCPDTVTCCTRTATLRLFDNSILESFYQDRVTLVRMYGDVYVRYIPSLGLDNDLCDPNDPDADVGDYAIRYGEQINVSVRKLNLTQQANENAIVDGGTPAFDYDWTEGRWLWQRMRLWRPPLRMGHMYLQTGSVIGVCSNTTQAGYTVPPTSSGSQPTYNVPDVETSCTPFTSQEGCPQSYKWEEAPLPPLHHFRLSIKRHIALRSDNFLDMVFALRHPNMIPTANSGSGWGCDPQQFPNEGGNWHIWTRIAAVVRLN